MARAYPILIILLITSFSFSQEKPLIIGMKQSAPFTMQDTDGNWTGVSVQLWEWIAQDLGLNYKIEKQDLKGLLSGVQTGNLDVSVGALTITKEREELFDFSNSFFNTDLAIAVRPERQGFLGIFRNLLSWQFIKVLLYLALGLILMTSLVWFFEKRHNNNPRNKHSDVHGMGWSFWWAIITLIGYDDAQPVSFGGRFIAVIWMVASVIGVSILTAVLTTVLTVNSLENSIRSLEDLRRANVVVATIAGSSSAEFLDREQIPYSTVYSAIDAALQAVADDELQAFVYDAPLIKNMVHNNFQKVLNVIEMKVAPQNYAFALPNASPYREDINRAILKYTSDTAWHDLLKEYFGE